MHYNQTRATAFQHLAKHQKNLQRSSLYSKFHGLFAGFFCFSFCGMLFWCVLATAKSPESSPDWWYKTSCYLLVAIITPRLCIFYVFFGFRLAHLHYSIYIIISKINFKYLFAGPYERVFCGAWSAVPLKIFKNKRHKKLWLKRCLWLLKRTAMSSRKLVLKCRLNQGLTSRERRHCNDSKAFGQQDALLQGYSAKLYEGVQGPHVLWLMPQGQEFI